MTSKDSDQPVHPPIMARVLLYPSLDMVETADATFDQQESLLGAHAICWFCHAPIHIGFHQEAKKNISLHTLLSQALI